MKRDVSLVRLSRDHNRGLVVAVRVQREAPGADSQRLNELQGDVLDFWRSALLPHFRAECECVLTRLARMLRADGELIARTQSDHLRLNTLAVAMEDGVPLDEARAVLLEMAQLLQAHIRWEESVLFESVQTMLSPAELGLLANDLADRIPEVPAAPPWGGDATRPETTRPGGQP